MRPDFKKIDFRNVEAKISGKEFAEKNNIEKDWMTAEQIPVKSVYSKEDLEGMGHLNYAAGLAPFLRA